MDLLTHFQGLKNELSQYQAAGLEDRAGEVQVELDRVGGLLLDDLAKMKADTDADNAAKIAEVEAQIASVTDPTPSEVPTAPEPATPAVEAPAS